MRVWVALENPRVTGDNHCTWKNTSCFIVDFYHYTNHHASDELCRTYCNPAPTDGSAPNLVGQKVDVNDVVHDVQEFNTQTCEQLSAWLGGFESILKWMTSKNFNWFLHVMLFYHVKHVLAKSLVPPVVDNQIDDDRDIGEEENDSDSNSEDKESGSSSDQESRNGSEEESTSSISGKDNVDLDSDENSSDNHTKDTTDSDGEVSIEDESVEMVEEDDEDEDEGDEEDEEEDKDKNGCR